MKPRIINWSGIVLCSALLLRTTGSAGQPGTAPDAQPTREQAAAPVSNDDANRDGTGSIRINGRWTITVTNADRSVASRHEFNNALTPSGAGLLTRLLGGSQSDIIDKWQVNLRSSSGADICADSAGLRLPCFIWEVGDTKSGAAHSANLLVGNAGSTLVLQGSIKTTFAGAIDDVETTIRNVNSIFAGQFTHHTLSTPIAVQAGQTIDVRVVISIS
jgi:hypothetical protein